MTEWYERCKKLMEERDLKQEDLLLVFGVKTRGAVGHYLTGRRTPTPLQVLAVAKRLGVTTEWLLTGREPVAGTEPPSTPYLDTAQNSATRALVNAILESDRRGRLSPATADVLRQLIVTLENPSAKRKIHS